MPAVYTIDDTAPNAFATGRDPAHASIAITTGLLEKLDREELQGVIGHELSHVRNLDIRFSLVVGVMLAVNRQREYLADASSVELTRNPLGLEQALAKIATDREVLEVANRGTQHMYFTNPIKKFEARSSSLMSTHPPILDRINRLRELTSQPPLSPEEASMLTGLE